MRKYLEERGWFEKTTAALRELKLVATFPGQPERKDIVIKMDKRTRDLDSQFKQAEAKLILDVKELDFYNINRVPIDKLRNRVFCGTKVSYQGERIVELIAEVA